MTASTRLEAVRTRLREEGLFGLWVRSTDRFLNEYVPSDDSDREWLTGFTGSMGEALVTADGARLFVDGRYWLQAETEVEPAWTIERVPLGQTLDQAVTRAIQEAGPGAWGLEGDRWLVADVEKLRRTLPPGCELRTLDSSPVGQVRLEMGDGPRPQGAPVLRSVPSGRTAGTTSDRLQRLWADVSEPVDAIWLHRLDDIAYMSGLRGEQLPFQATFKSVALATRDRVLIGLTGDEVPTVAADASVTLLTERELWRRIESEEFPAVGFDPEHTPQAVRDRLARVTPTVQPFASPLARMKAIKSAAEMEVMQDAFQRADRAVERAIAWACRSVVGGARVTEASFADRIRHEFASEGALGHSFRTISAAGENGAIIHYAKADPERELRRGELMLVDCGGYFEEGYATDLTRTFLVGSPDDKPTARQRALFTSVLKAAIAGMTARFPVGTTGGEADTIVRSQLWAEGLQYAHGTGHGVGINVHEFPPRLGPKHASVLAPQMVFSVEPGVYIPGFGGVRIENLCTCEVDPEVPGFLRIRPLTFCPLDERLIDRDRLDAGELEFLTPFLASKS